MSKAKERLNDLIDFTITENGITNEAIRLKLLSFAEAVIEEYCQKNMIANPTEQDKFTNELFKEE